MRVEVVGFYTPGYLRSKLEALRAAASRPIIACIDESLACEDGGLPVEVLRFKRRIDAQALIAVAERMREQAMVALDQVGASWATRARGGTQRSLRSLARGGGRRQWLEPG